MLTLLEWNHNCQVEIKAQTENIPITLGETQRIANQGNQQAHTKKAPHADGGEIRSSRRGPALGLIPGDGQAMFRMAGPERATASIHVCDPAGPTSIQSAAGDTNDRWL